MMIKTFLPVLGLALLSAFTLSHCSKPSGAVQDDMIMETLLSAHIAVTPHIPGWLLEPKHIHLLTNDDKLKLEKIAAKGTPRNISVDFYKDEQQGNRGDDSKSIFYLYATNAQCLGCRIVDGNRVLMDDLDLPMEETKQLFVLLKPYYDKMKAAGAPKLKKVIDASTDADKGLVPPAGSIVKPASNTGATRSTSVPLFPIPEPAASVDAKKP